MHAIQLRWGLGSCPQQCPLVCEAIPGAAGVGSGGGRCQVEGSQGRSQEGTPESDDAHNPGDELHPFPSTPTRRGRRL